MRSLSAGMLCLGLLVAGLLSPPGARADVPLDLDALRGRVVYLDFWASWCTPCRHSFPWMQAMEHTYAKQGLTVIAVNLDHDRSDAERFLRQYSPGFEVRFDPEGRLAQRYGVAGMPTSVLIDRHGKPQFTHIGFRAAEEATYEQHIRALIAEG